MFSINPTKRYDSMIISSPDFELNETYTILYGGTYDGDSLDATLYTNGTLVNYTDKATVTLNDLLSLISPDGTATEYVGQKGGARGQGGHR